MKSIIAMLALLLLGACAPEYACDRYGFQRGTPAFAQCIQNEELTQRQIYARRY